MFKFVPILKSVIWGGDRIVSYKHIETELQHVGESWEISGVDNNLSVVSEGPCKGLTIADLMVQYRDRLVGRDNYARYGNRFPLLVKFIDARRDLSIQVHPNDALARQRHGTCGKDEMWYVVDALPDAHLCSGFSAPLDPENYDRVVADGTIMDVLHYDKVKAGDVFYLPAGRVHSLGAGSFVVEVQQTSDITYRIYDYNRRDKNGKLRELHVEMAKDAIDYTILPDYRTRYAHRLNEPVQLVNSSKFVVSLYELTEPMECDYSELDSFVIYICIEGGALLVDSEGQKTRLSTGETVLVPALSDTISILPESKVKLLEVFV